MLGSDITDPPARIHPRKTASTRSSPTQYMISHSSNNYRVGEAREWRRRDGSIGGTSMVRVGGLFGEEAQADK